MNKIFNKIFFYITNFEDSVLNYSKTFFNPLFLESKRIININYYI